MRAEQRSRILFNDTPQFFGADVAMIVGVPGAVVLQQVHFWTTNGRSQERDGHRWVYNSYPAWQAQFPYWSIDQIGRIVRKLEELGFLVSTAKYARAAGAGDNTKWYRIDHDALETAVSALNVRAANSHEGRAESHEHRAESHGLNRNRRTPEEHTYSTAAAAAISEPSKTKPAKPRRRIPDDFTLTPELRAYAIAHGVDPDREFESFVEFWRGDGRPKADWNATFRTRCLEQEKRRHEHAGAATKGMPPEIAALAPNAAKRLLWEEKRRLAAAAEAEAAKENRS